MIGSMSDPDGYRKVQSEGRISLPKSFREENSINKGDIVNWKRHSKDKAKLIIEVSDN